MTFEMLHIGVLSLMLNAGSSESDREPEAAQGEAAQGFESAQEEFAAPQLPATAASSKGRPRAKSRAADGRPVTKKASVAAAAEGKLRSNLCVFGTLLGLVTVCCSVYSLVCPGVV